MLCYGLPEPELGAQNARCPQPLDRGPLPPPSPRQCFTLHIRALQSESARERFGHKPAEDCHDVLPPPTTFPATHHHRP